MQIAMAEENLSVNFPHKWDRHKERTRDRLNSSDLEAIAKYVSCKDVGHILREQDMEPRAQWRPALKSFQTFIEFFERNLGSHLDASFFWGALSCLLLLVNNNPKELHKVPSLIISLAAKAEDFNINCKNFQSIDYAVRETCFDMQVMLVEFFTHSISYIHMPDNHLEHRENNRSLLESILECHTTAENEIEQALVWIKNRDSCMIPMRVQIPSSKNNQEAAPTIRCSVLSPTITQLFDRFEYFDDLDRILLPAVKDIPFLYAVLHGGEGVGKSAIAATYINERYRQNVYDVVLWVRGENQTYLRQSFTEIALRLKLPGASFQTHDENYSLLQEWFQTTESKWLVVYDNVNSADLLTSWLPKTTQGRAIFTTCQNSDAFRFPGEKLQVHPWNEHLGSDFLFFLLKDSVGLDENSQSEKEAALFLSREFSGHALALLNIAGLIHNGGCSIKEVMDIYKENPRKIHAAEEFAKLWKFAFGKVREDSHTLLGVISWLMPDKIPLDIFKNGVDRNFADGLEFCLEKFSFLRAMTPLIKLYLIKKNREEQILSTHKVIQAHFKKTLNEEQRQASFNRAVYLLHSVLPKQDILRGQLYGNWDIYNQYMQHVTYLKDCFMEESIGSIPLRATVEFCELLIQCQRYLYEINALTELENFFEVSLAALSTLDDGEQKRNLQADVMSYQANRAESLGKANEAISLNMKVYNIRQCVKCELLGHVTNNIGYCHNSAGNHEESLYWLEKSYKWWMDNEKPIPSFLWTNMARCMIYQSNFSSAREKLVIAINQLEREEDWAMLAYTYFVQGVMKRQEGDSTSAEACFKRAQSVWMKGNKRLHPFHGACMYKIALCSLEQGKNKEAIEELCNSMEVTSHHKNSTPVEHVRNLIELSKVIGSDSCGSIQHEDVKKWLDEEWLKKAKNDLKKDHSEVENWDMDGVYDNFIPIFWR